MYLLHRLIQSVLDVHTGYLYQPQVDISFTMHQ